jgi:mRNA interferase MazF
VSDGPAPRRGEVWDADLGLGAGSEQEGIRPVLIVSSDRFNALRHRLCIVLALTRTDRKLRIHVRVQPPEGGLDRPSVVQCEQVRAISYDRLRRRRGVLGRTTLRLVDDRMRDLQDL